MASPTVTLMGTGSSKVSGTTLAVTLTSTSYVSGDVVAVGFGMDPSSGTVSFVKSAGTATVGAWTVEQTVANGSGTSGARGVFGWAKVTASGTITTVTVTLPTAIAKAAEVFKISGADTTTPVQTSASNASTFVQVTPTTAGVDGLLIITGVYEATTGAATTPQTLDLSWVDAGHDTVDIGTSGSPSAGNISVAYMAESNTHISTAVLSPSMNGTSLKTLIGVLFQRIPANTAPGTPTGVAVALGGSRLLTVTWTDETSSFPIATYNILRSTNNISFGSVATGIAAETQTYTDTGLSNNTTYWYKVEATNASGTTDSTSASGTPVATYYVNIFDEGTNTTAITIGNSGGGINRAFDSVGGTAPTYSSTQFLFGSGLSGSFNSTLAPSEVEWVVPSTSSAFIRAYFYITAYPTSVSSFMSIGLSGTTLNLSMTASSPAGKLFLDGLTVSTSIIPLNTWVRIEAGYISGSLRSVRYYADYTSSTITEILTDTTVTGNINTVQFGTGNQTNMVWFTDNVAYTDDNWIGPAVPYLARLVKLQAITRASFF